MRPLNLLRNALFFCVPACICLTSCTPAEQGSAFQPKHDAAYSMQAEMQYGEGQTAQLMLTRYSGDLWEAAFAEPASLAGVVIKFDGNAVSASYKGLEFTVPKSALAAKNMLEYATDALDYAAETDQLSCVMQEDGTWCYTADSDGGSYTVRFAATGEPVGFDMPSQPLCMNFSAYMPIADTAEAAESTACTTITTAAETTAAAETMTEAQTGTSE